MSFDLFIGIDYSGAQTPTSRLAGLQVYALRPGVAEAEAWFSPTRSNDGQRVGTADEFRLTERWTSSAKSVFQLDEQGTVGKSTHAGIPWLRWLRDELGARAHFWPFDGWTVPAEAAVASLEGWILGIR